MEMDTIFLRDLEVDATIGVFEWEQRSRAAASCSLEDTLDYKAVAKRIVGFVESGRHELIETLVENLAETLIREFSIPWLRITVSKPGAVRGARDVGITIERGTRN